jgi:hypothetical protein
MNNKNWLIADIALAKHEAVPLLNEIFAYQGNNGSA